MEREGKTPATIKKARWFLELLDGIASRPIADVGRDVAPLAAA
jgi:hypothetical protein